MIKLTAGRLFLRTAELLAAGKSDVEIMNDSKIAGFIQTAEKLHFYVMIIDQRNMPAFPANEAPVGFGVPFMVKLSNVVPTALVAMFVSVVVVVLIGKIGKGKA